MRINEKNFKSENRKILESLTIIIQFRLKREIRFFIAYLT